MDHVRQHADRKSAAFLAYVTWNRVVPWKILSLPRDRGGRFVPVGYGAGRRQSGRKPRNLLKQVRPGDTIYVVTIPGTGVLGLPPTLIARLRVSALCYGEIGRSRLTPNLTKMREIRNAVAIADPCASEFYGLNDATAALRRLGIITGRAATKEDRLRVIRRELHQRLQKLLRLKASAEQVARVFSSCMRHGSRRAVFISYARIDGESHALELARQLLHLGCSPWLDALAIPLYDARKEDTCRPRRLQKLLELGISQCAVGISIVTNAYLTKKDECGFVWTRREWNQMVRRERQDRAWRHVRAVLAERPIRPQDEPFSRMSMRDVAKGIMARCSRQLSR